jgi:hypothetical protein
MTPDSRIAAGREGWESSDDGGREIESSAGAVVGSETGAAGGATVSSVISENAVDGADPSGTVGAEASAGTVRTSPLQARSC